MVVQDVVIEVAAHATPEVLEGLNRILPQLSSSAPALTLEELEEICVNDTVFIARDNGVIVGSLTLVIFRLPTGLRAWIEDVVVDQAARGRGVGEALNKAAIKATFDSGARTLDLTSRPSREAANRLYRKLGFKARETNVYRFAGDNWDA
jgi:ribosomal protein S18 acetylase RimI-like enzyme